MLTLVIGGAASGKSEYAEAVCLSSAEPRTYLATMERGGADAAARIARHRELRAGKGFSTIERPCDIAGLSNAPSGTVLVECLGTLAANEIFSPAGSGPDAALDAIVSGIEALDRAADHVVIVSNDVFSDGIIYDRETDQYRTVLAAANERIAARAENVIEVVCGIPVAVKERGISGEQGGAR